MKNSRWIWTAGFILSFVLVTLPAWGKQRSRNLASLNTGEVLKVTIVYGDKASEFHISSEAGEKFILHFSNQTTKRSREILKRDVDYLMSKMKMVPIRIEANSQCSRQWMQSAYILTGNSSSTEISACIKSDTETARGLKGVVNLLSTLI